DLRDKRLLSFDSDKLTRLELTAKKQTLEFGRNAQNEWQIVKPVPLRADNGQVEEIVRRLKDAKMDLNLADDEKKKAASAFGGAELIASAKVTDAAGTQSLEVRKAKDNTWYAKSSAVEGAHKIEASLGEGLDKGLDELRSRKLFDFGFSDPGKVELKWDTKSFTFTKSGEDWLAGGKKMDSFAVQSLIDKLRDLAAIKFPLTAPEGSTVELTVTSNAGKRIEKVRVAKTADNFWYARRDGEPAIYEVDGKIIEDLQKAAGAVKEASAARK
nr:DUF4340 domain-containing protein [Bryobacter sp.]